MYAFGLQARHTYSVLRCVCVCEPEEAEMSRGVCGPDSCSCWTEPVFL